MIDLDVLPQALLFTLVIIGLYFTVRSVMKPTIREGATGSRSSPSKEKTLPEKIMDMTKKYDAFIKASVPSDNQKLAALKDAKIALSKAGMFIALEAFSGDAGDSVIQQAPGLIAMRQLIDQAIKDVQGGGSGGGSSNDNSDGDNGGGGGGGGSWL